MLHIFKKKQQQLPNAATNLRFIVVTREDFSSVILHGLLRRICDGNPGRSVHLVPSDPENLSLPQETAVGFN